MNRTLLTILASTALASVSMSVSAQNASVPQVPLTAAGTPQGGAAPATVPAASPGTQSGPSARGSESDELANLQRQIPLWKARAEIAKYQADVRKSDPVSGLSAPLPGAATPVVQGQAPVPAMVAPVQAEGPRALSLRAYDGKYSAVVEVNGQATTVRTGDTLEGGWKVASVDGAGIKLVNGKRVRMLRP
jgi:type IV pilus biogenesis protein PilP